MPGLASVTNVKACICCWQCQMECDFKKKKKKSSIQVQLGDSFPHTRILVPLSVLTALPMQHWLKTIANVPFNKSSLRHKVTSSFKLGFAAWRNVRKRENTSRLLDPFRLRRSKTHKIMTLWASTLDLSITVSSVNHPKKHKFNKAPIINIPRHPIVHCHDDLYALCGWPTQQKDRKSV